MSSIKKILLVNDTRGAQEYLYRAFIEMGLECDLAYFGWSSIKPIDNMLNFDPLRKFGILSKPIRPILNIIKLNGIDNYDVASFVHRISFIDRPHLLKYLDLPIIRNKANVMSYTALGCDELGFIANNDSLPYSPCNTCQLQDDIQGYCPKVVRPLFNTAKSNLNKYFDCVTSVGVEYSHLQNHFKKDVHPMPLPVDLGEIPWSPSSYSGNRKVKIIHTPSRSGFKGTTAISKAIEILSSHRNDFEFSIISGLSFNDYIKAVSEADVIIDQVWSQSPGMNALWLLGMGKIVLSGNTILAQEYMTEYKESPIIDASPIPHILANTISNVIDNKEQFKEQSERGISYLRKHHDYMKVADRYLKLWTNV